jgi:hypothetical protein
MNTPQWITMANCAQVRFPNRACLELNGMSQYVQLGAMGVPAMNAAQTIAVWVYWSAAPSGTQNFVAFGAADGSRLQLGFRGGNVVAWKRSGMTLVSAADPPAGAWHHFAYTFDGTTHRLYIDGVQGAMSTAAPDTAAVTAARLGVHPTTATNEPFRGRLDDVRLYGRALNANEVAALAAGFDN